MDVQLEWINKSQTAKDYFVVEKSADGVHFDSLHRQDGSGPSDKVEIYRDMDLNPFEGYNYYRLKLVYKDGSFEYSNIEVVKFNPDSDFTIFPNPASDRVTVYLDRFMGKEVDLVIVNTLGEVLYEQHITEVKDKLLPIALNRAVFLDGIYSVSVIHLGRAQSKRLIISRF
ncbi:MAG: T9SS type A sorting domain-containing protein [Saprospiraceae bacterium]|nr:T9SS type A sorting domain-containing protein [Saprospiraceae bacterium]